MKRTTSARVAPISPRSNPDLHHHPLNDLESSAPLQPKEAPYDTGLGRKKQPFWRTTKGIVILGLVLLAIILAAVLGGVLGSRNKGKNINIQSGNGQGGSGDGSKGTSGGSASSVITPIQSASATTKPSSTMVQPIGGTASGTSGSGNSGTTAPTGGDAGSQTGANGGSGTTGGTTTGMTEAPSTGTGPNV